MTTDTKPQVSTSRTRARRERLRSAGWTFTQIELSPLAASAMTCLRSGTKETQSEVIERAILALYQKRS